VFRRKVLVADSLTFETCPVFEVARNFFFNVPVIVQYEQSPLLEVVPAGSGFTPQFTIYHPDGTYLAQVKGAELHPTDDGKKADLSLDPGAVTVCRMGGKTLFELRLEAPSTLTAYAELHAPGGALVKFTPAEIGGVAVNAKGEQVNIRRVWLQKCLLRNLPVGLWVSKEGTVGIGDYPP
jgi:hypothetical protein